jgi:hypothetical protein
LVGEAVPPPGPPEVLTVTLAVEKCP